MEKILYIIPIIVITSFIMVQKASARVDNNVNVYSNGSGASSQVEVQNNVGTSTGNNTSTHIRVESNGQVKEYDSSQPGDITIQSNDGKATAHVNTIINNTEPTTASAHLNTQTTKPKPFNIVNFLHNLFSFKLFGK
ncbi:MAG TPA: hypothetical protein VMR41_05870 [Patescibacteria group bacterium]|nr:hypothetical protein [Patescibacteria group bacterium]